MGKNLCYSSAPSPVQAPSVRRNSNVSIMPESKPEFPGKNLVESQLGQAATNNSFWPSLPMFTCAFLPCASNGIRGVFQCPPLPQVPVAVLTGWGSSSRHPALNSYKDQPLHQANASKTQILPGLEGWSRRRVITSVLF